MIAFLEGIVAQAGCDAVIKVGGSVGLDVRLSAVSADRLPPVGEKVHLFTHLTVREDNWSLYGFVDQKERSMFRLLITVSGVGPKVAMGMLSKASGDDIATALRMADEKALVRLPGIGKKSAARLIVELGKNIPESFLEGTSLDASADSTLPAGKMTEAVSVLQAMGLAPAAAEQALLKARQSNPEISEDLEGWVRAALRGV
ncbi:MAG: Holliday junction branch migration protein RuvA [bacterium]|nr:Holliday junction branch migration protein RuvA [bacterium]